MGGIKKRDLKKPRLHNMRTLIYAPIGEPELIRSVTSTPWV